MDECSTCYNHLRNLKAIDSNIQLEFIFAKRYQEDSVKVLNSLGLDGYPAIYIWSDSLNKANLINGMFSGVHFTNSEQTQSYSFVLKNSFTAELTDYFNRLSKPTDTIVLEEGLLTSGIQPLIYKGIYVYIRDTYRNGISRVSLITGKEELFIPMTDSLSKIAFLKKFGKADAWQKARSIITHYGLLKYQTFGETFIDDERKVYALGEYTYFNISTNKIDTTETRFYVLHTFAPDGKLLNTANIYQINDDSPELALAIQKNEIKDTTLYFYTTSSLWVDDNAINLDIRGFSTPGTESAKKYFRGNFLKNSNGEYAFHAYYDQALPPVYKGYGYNMSNIKYSYDGKYFALPLSDALYSIEDPENIQQLDFFDGKQFEGVPFRFNMTVNQVNVDERSTIFTCYWLKEGNQIRYLKYNPDSGLRNDTLVHTQAIPKDKVRYIKTDYFDYNYLVVPIANNKLLRFKVFP